MFKILGALLVTAATTSLGLRSAARLRSRAKSLSGFVFALGLIKTEICNRLTPLPELLELLARQTEEPVNMFFADCLLRLRSSRGKPFAEVWGTALRNSRELELNDGELETLRELGSALGRYDTERQGEAINSAKKRLETQLQKAESERDKESKTRTMLGLAAGLAIAIIFF